MILIIAFLCDMVLMGLQRIVYQKYWNQNLDVKITYKTVDCIAGEENELIEVITNNKWLPLPMLHVKFDTPKSFIFENENNSSVSDYYYRDDVFTVMGHQSVTRTLKFTCTGRGCFYMHDTSITSSDLFLNTTLTDRRKNNAVIHVFPKKVDVSFFEVPFNTITGNFATQRNLIEDPFEFRGIREYQPYDSMRRINWKSSAKNDELQVNTFFMTSSQDVRILLNLDTQIYSRNDRLIESIISLASSIAEKLIHAGIPVGLITNGKDVFTGEQILQKSGSGARHMLSLDTAFARLNTHTDNLNFVSILKDSLEHASVSANDYTYFIIISNNRSKEIRDVYEQSKTAGIASYFIVPELAQYNVEEVIPDMLKRDIDY